MSKTYRAWNPDQDWLLPPSPRDWLPDGDLVYFMLDVVQALDLSAIIRKYEKEDRGSPPYHPRMMVTLLLYRYCVGVYSSRRIQKRCERDAAYRVIVGDDVPDFRTISDFRKLHLPELQGLFVMTNNRLFRWSSSPRRIFKPPAWMRRSAFSTPTPVTSAERTCPISKTNRSIRTLQRSG